MKRNFGLDLLRAISIWLVLAQHGGLNIIGLSPLKIGSIGVEIFFVLSGFLIGGILLKDIDKNLSAKHTLLNFWTRRWFRILPLYYIILLFKFIFLDHSIGYNIIYYFLFLQNNFYGIDFLAVSWSLVIEEWFYLFVPIFLFVAFRVLKSEKLIFAALISFVGFVIVMRIIYVKHGNVPYEGVNGNFPFRFDALFLGVILAFLKHKQWKLFLRLQSPWIFSLGLLLFFFYIYYYWTLAYPINQINIVYFPRTLGFFILPFTIALMVPFVSKIVFNEQKNRLSLALYTVITSTSILTYAIYLIHSFIYDLVFQNLLIYPLLQWILIIGLTYTIAWLIYRFIEKPILNFRDKITV